MITGSRFLFVYTVAEKKQWSVFTSTVGVIIAALVFITMSVITSVVVIRFARKNNARQSNLPRYGTSSFVSTGYFKIRAYNILKVSKHTECKTDLEITLHS